MIGSIRFLNNRHFIIHERFNKLIYGIDTIMKCGSRQPVKFSKSFVFVMKCFFIVPLKIFYRTSELMLPTLIQRYDKNIISVFDPVQKRDTNCNFTGCQIPYFMIVLILYINLLNLSWITKKF